MLVGEEAKGRFWDLFELQEHFLVCRRERIFGGALRPFLPQGKRKAPENHQKPR